MICTFIFGEYGQPSSSSLAAVIKNCILNTLKDKTHLINDTIMEVTLKAFQLNLLNIKFSLSRGWLPHHSELSCYERVPLLGKLISSKLLDDKSLQVILERINSCLRILLLIMFPPLCVKSLDDVDGHCLDSKPEKHSVNWAQAEKLKKAITARIQPLHQP